MKKTFALEELDCAVCAQKLEDAIQKLEGVKEARVSFLAQKLTLETDEADLEAVLKRVEKVIRRVEPDCRLVR